MDKENRKYRTSEDALQNGTTDFAAGIQKTDMTDDMQKGVNGKNSFKKRNTKDDKSMLQPVSSSKKDSFGGKYKGKKKKSLVCEDFEQVSSNSPKHNKNSRKQLVNETNFDYSDVLAKMHSSDNMRKPSKPNRQMSVPNDPSELKSYTSTPLNYSSCKNFAKSPKTDTKYRSKTPECKGASGNTPGRKSSTCKKSIKFEPYIPLFQVQQGLKRGEFIEGALRINPRNYEDAYVNSPDGKMDIYIGGMQNRNRALNGDIVVVQINPKQEWKVLCDAIKDYQEKSGKTFVETICEPVFPSASCKVHTPDPFVRPRPYSSNSWDGACGGRSPDTLEILGIDKLAKQFENISVKQKTSSKSKSKRRSKCGKQEKETGSQKSSTASYSQESSEDCLDKLSPGQCSDKDKKETILKEDPNDEGENYANSLAKDNLSCIPPENFPFRQTYTLCDMEEIGEFHIETKINQDDTRWTDNENSVNLIISPEELLHIDGNSLLNSTSFHEMDTFNDDSCSDVGVVVAPGDLSGDEFTDSASVGSSYSEHMEKVLEDSEFLACQQDAENNNFEVISQSTEIVTNITNNDSLVTLQTAKVATECSLDAQCKMQYNKSVPSVASFHMNSEVICSAVPDTFPNEQIETVDENIIFQSLSVGEFSVSPAIIKDSNQCNSKTNSKKSRHRKKKKKSNAAKNKCVSDNFDGFNNLNGNISDLTVDQVMQHPEWPKFIQKTGKVVHILERKHSCLVAGHLKLFPDKNVKWALFSPNDSRVPRIMIPMSDCPQNFFHRPYDYMNVLFLAEIIQWNENSNFAMGRLVRSLGNSGDIAVETEGILIENGVDTQEFEEEVLLCLPESKDWNIPTAELGYRRDFRNQCVFTIDPSTARDMDDAVSCALLDNGNYQVGVHIADVTYFVPEGTELDKIAKERSTSVYLVEKVIPMLPRRLCDDLCSLNPGKDRLTFSVVWEMSPEGEVINEWIGRSVINSCIKLSYEHAQDMIEHPTRPWTQAEHPEMYGNFKIQDVIKRVNELHHLAVKLRSKRFMDGALRLDQVKLQFTLDSETGLPSGFNVFVQKDSNKLIEEFMLLANMSVAAKIYETFPSLSLLRRHPQPQAKPMQDIVSMCESMGVVLDATTSGTLQSSIAQYKGEDYLANAMVLVLMNLCSKPMNCALYFCTGILEDTNLFHHYALNVPLYTHFTSPIRRYPDIIVHRLLGAALHYNLPPNMSALGMQKCAMHCNDKKYSAKKVSELSAELFLAAFIRSLGSVHSKAMVIGVMDHSFDCLILDMGIIKRVYCDKLPLLKKEYQRSHGVSYLNLTWKHELVNEGIKQTIIMFTLIDVILTVDSESLQIKAALKKPQN